MKIREATAGDFDAIAEITNHYILTTPIHFGYQPQTGAELRDPWARSRGMYPFLVMEHDAAAALGTAARSPKAHSPLSLIVGYAKAYRWRERAAYDRIA